jgi:alpha-amylase
MMRNRLLLAFVTVLLAMLWGCSSSSSSGSTANPAPLPAVDVSSVAAADPGSVLPAAWQNGAFMEIFVRSYQDSNGDGIGDLQGLISRLDYLQQLGIRGIWLMPVMASEDHDHGYAVADYRRIETAYGSTADLDALVSAAHARGIGVIIDYVMNHSAGTNPLFVNSRASASNPYRSWYVWQDPAPSGWSIYGANPWYTTANGAYFAAFNVEMPDWNLLEPRVVAYHQDNLRFWLNRGVDGFRFDAVGNFIENGPGAWADQPGDYTLAAQMRALLDGYQRRYMVCEGPGNPQGYAATGACGSAFAFDLKASLLAAARGDGSAVSGLAAYFQTAQPDMATLLSNHDSFAGQRPWDQLGGNVAQYKMAAASYLLMPGTPFLYYGEEIGMAGAAPSALTGDPSLRTPMSWTADPVNAGFSTVAPYRSLSANSTVNNVAAQAADPASILNFYKAMLALRNTLPAISQGSFVSPQVSGLLLAVERVYSGSPAQHALVVFNYGPGSGTISVTGLAAGAKAAGVYPAGTAPLSADAGGALSVNLPAQSVAVYTLTP